MYVTWESAPLPLRARPVLSHVLWTPAEGQRETGQVGVRLPQEECHLQGWCPKGLENFSSSELLGFSAHMKAQ